MIDLAKLVWQTAQAIHGSEDDEHEFDDWLDEMVAVQGRALPGDGGPPESGDPPEGEGADKFPSYGSKRIH